MNPETVLQLKMLGEVGASATHRLWRNASGHYYAGKLIRHGPGLVTLGATDAVIRGCTPIHAGLCDGAADLVGILSVPVASLPADGMAGLFLAIEVKTPDGTVQPHQRAWREMILALGGVAGVARSVEEARGIVGRRT